MNAKRKAFTLIELLVVVSIIALLVSILLPALNKARLQAKSAVCKTHLNQMMIGFNIFAADNEGNLPSVYYAHWPVDINYATTDLIISTGGSKYTFFCPLEKIKSGDLNFLWRYSEPGTAYNTATLANIQSDEAPDLNRMASIRVVGYMCLLPPSKEDTAGVSYAEYRSVNFLRAKGKDYAYKITDRFPSEQEVVFDYVYSGDDPSGGSNGSDRDVANFATYINLWGLGGLSTPLYEPPPHINPDGTPQGSNIAFLDGHVAFRDFADMEYRLTPYGDRVSGNPCKPYMWW